jgi:hypothetical protein
MALQQLKLLLAMILVEIGDAGSLFGGALALHYWYMRLGGAAYLMTLLLEARSDLLGRATPFRRLSRPRGVFSRARPGGGSACSLVFGARGSQRNSGDSHGRAASSPHNPRPPTRPSTRPRSPRTRRPPPPPPQ